MNLIEPTYLRYVHDSLNKGSINSENAAALPYGFIGLYEEAFQSNIPISKRQTTLKRLAIWALFKGGVSSYLASQILNESQEKTKSLIDSFSSWFNTTDSNKYILYHDRLRSYLLQKLSSHELQLLNEQIISYLEKALETQNGEEAEIYALEHLSTHMVTESQMDNNYQRLHDLANKEALWPRQVSISKEYKWSQQAVQYSIKEGARRHHEKNTLKAALNQIELIEIEESKYDEILNLIEIDELDFCLKRVFNWKGENKFKICLLILTETLFGRFSEKVIDDSFFIQITNELSTLLSEEKNIRKNKEETGNVETLIIDWTKFMPQIVVYHIHLALENKEIDFSFMWVNHKNANFKDIINFDYGNLREKNKWMIPIDNVCRDNPNLENFIELAKFTLRNNYTGSFQEYLRCINLVLDLYDKKQKEYYKKYVHVFEELFNNNFIKNFDTKEIENEIFSRIINQLAEVNDFHEKKDIFSTLVYTFKNTNYANIISDKILDLFNSTSYSENYELKSRYEFSELLYENNSFENALDLIIDSEIYSYQIFINLLKSNISSSLKLNILDKVSSGLVLENEYNIRYNSYDNFKTERSELLIQICDFHIEMSNPHLALISLNKIDLTKEHKFHEKFFPNYEKIARLDSNKPKEDYSFNSSELVTLFFKEDEYVNYNLSKNELKSLFVIKDKNFDNKINNILTSSSYINDAIQQFMKDILCEDGQFICGEKGGLIDNLISNNYFDLALDLIDLLTLEQGYWRNKYLFELAHVLLNQNRINDVKSIFKDIDTEIFKFQFLVIVLKKHFKKYNNDELYNLIYELKNPLLKIYLVFILHDILSKGSENVETKELDSLITDLTYSNLIKEIFEIYNKSNNNHLIEFILKNHEEEIENKTSITIENLDENLTQFYSDFYEMEALNCFDDGINLLKYFYSKNDQKRFSEILNKVHLKIMTENSSDEAINESFDNIISLNIIDENFSKNNKFFATKIIENIKLNKIKVNSVLLYNWFSKFCSITYINFVIKNNLIFGEIKGETENIIELIINQFNKDSQDDLYKFLFKHCTYNSREKLLEKILLSNFFSTFIDNKLFTLINIYPKLKTKGIEFAFFNRLSFRDILFNNKNTDLTTNLENTDLIKNLPEPIKNLKNYKLIIKCIDDNKILTYNRENLSILAKELSSLNLFDEALQICELISEDEFNYHKHGGYPDGDVNYENSMKSYVLKSVSRDLLNIGLVDKCIEVANKINDLNIRFLFYNELREILKYNLKNFDFAYEKEIFKLYKNQIKISSWSLNYWEGLENAFSTDVDSIFSSLVNEYNLHKNKSIITKRISDFLNRYLDSNFDTCSLNKNFLIEVTNFLLSLKSNNFNYSNLSSYLEKILLKTELYIQKIINDNNEPTEHDNDMLYVGGILSNICLKLNKSLMEIRKRFLDYLITIVENPNVYEANDINWNSYYQNEPYSKKLNEQGGWLEYASLCFDVFKILNTINDSRTGSYLEKTLNYINESEKRFHRNNEIADLSKAFSDLKWYSNVPFFAQRPKWHHTARPNEIIIETLKYFSKKNDTTNFKIFLEIFSAPNSKTDSDKDFKYVNFQNIKSSNKLESYKSFAFKKYQRLKSDRQNKILNNSSGEIKYSETFNPKDQSVVKNGIFCDDIFGKYSFLVEDLNDYDILNYGHIDLSYKLINTNTMTILLGKDYICDLIGLQHTDRVVQLSKLLSNERYVVVQPGTSLNKKGEPLTKMDFLTEEEYLDILDTLPKENQYLEDSDSNKFIARIGSDAIYELIKKNYSSDYVFQHKNKSFNLAELINLLFIKVIPVLNPKLRPAIKLDDGKYALSELNELYRKIILRNNRLKRLIEIKAPEVILRNEKINLQKSYDELENQYSKYENEVNKANSNTLISFYIYLLSELKEFSKIYNNYLSFILNYINKELENNSFKKSKITLEILEVLQNSLKFHTESNENEKCDEISKHILMLQNNLLDKEYKSYCINQFIYTNNEKAISFFNSNYKGDKIDFSNRLNFQINEEKIDINNYYPLLYTFNENIDILKKYTTNFLKPTVY